MARTMAEHEIMAIVAPHKERSNPERAKLVFLVDVIGWAYDNIANRVSPGLTADYEISRLYVKDYPDIADLLGALVNLPANTILHVFWRPILFDLLDPVVVRRCEARQGLPAGAALKSLAALIITTSVYDHLGLDPAGARQQAIMLSALDGYSTASPILDGIYHALPGMPAPAAMLPDGVDLAFYAPHHLSRLEEIGRPFRIGWVGNSQWGFLEGIPDAKGLESVIRPAISLLKARGLDVELHLVDRAQTWRPREEVAAFYSTLDVYLCASLVEGTPNPVLEAMASGVPIVSTDVGIVRMCLGERQSDYIAMRTPDAFADALDRLLTTPGLRAVLSAENLASIGAHEWEKRQPNWQIFFTTALARGAQRSAEHRHAALLSVAFTMKPTVKQRIRSLLRRNPWAYGVASRVLHFASTAYGFACIRCLPALDRMRNRVRKNATDAS